MPIVGFKKTVQYSVHSLKLKSQCRKISNLNSVLKIRILANTTQTTLWVNCFKEWYHELLKRFTFWAIWESSKIREKSILLIREIAAIFNSFQRSSASGQKLLLTWCCTSIYQLPKALRLHKNVSQINFCSIVLGFHYLHLDCVLFGGRNNPQL